MEVILGIENIEKVSPSVITVGNFDGIHLGHQHLLTRVKDIAREREITGTLVTFDRHPRSVVSSNSVNKVKILTNLEEKIDIVEKFGIDRVLIIKFTREFSELTYTQFIENILLSKLGMKAIVVGHDHAFGRDREGNISSLEGLKNKHNFDVFEVGPHRQADTVVSSSRIRESLQSGMIEDAAHMLGRPYSISGIVVRGEGRGRQLSFPTANISAENNLKLLPKEGVYVVDCNLSSGEFRGMANIGYKPTFGSRDKTIEVHLFDFSSDIYGDRISIEFLKRLRGERKFNNEQELIEQLNIDKNRSYTI